MKRWRMISGICVGIFFVVLFIDIYSFYIFGFERVKMKGFGLVKLGIYKSVYFFKDVFGVFFVFYWFCVNLICFLIWK